MVHFRVEGFLGLGFRVQGLGFRVLGYRASGFRVFGFRILVFLGFWGFWGFWVFWVSFTGLRVRVSGLGFRVGGFFRVLGPKLSPPSRESRLVYSAEVSPCTFCGSFRKSRFNPRSASRI